MSWQEKVITIVNAISQMGFDHRTLQFTVLPTELNEISTNSVSGGGYEPTMVYITLGKGVYHNILNDY